MAFVFQFRRTSRPSSRSGSEYRREHLDYSSARYYPRPPYYEYREYTVSYMTSILFWFPCRIPLVKFVSWCFAIPVDHRFILHYSGGPRMHKRDVDYWTNVREVEPKKYMNWFKVTFPKEYAEWYSRYVTQKSLPNTGSYQADRRGSGHSGQSSVNNDSISVNEEK